MMSKSEIAEVMETSRPIFHPFVQGLLKELPKAGTPWPEEQRKLWLDTAASIFKMIYKDGPNKLPPLPYTKEAAN